MIASLLPGLRDLRAPLISGYVWLALVLVAFEGRVPSFSRAPDALEPLLEGRPKAWPIVLAIAVTVIAYLVGSLAIELIRGVASLVTSPPLFGAPGGRLSPVGHADVEGAVADRVLEIRRRLETAALEPGEAGVAPEPEAAAVKTELPALRTRLLGSEDAIVGEVDRLQTEAELRIAMFFPAVATCIALGVRFSAWWGLLAIGLVAVLYQGYRRHVEAGDRLASALRLGKADAPLLTAFERSANTALADLASERQLRSITEGGDPTAAFELGKLLDRRRDRRGALVAFQTAATRGVVKANVEAGRLHELGGDPRAAESCYRDAETHGDRRAAALLARLLQREGRPEEATTILERAQKRGDAERVRAVRQALRSPVTESTLRLEARAAAGDANALHNLALRRGRAGDHAEAVTLLSTALQGKRDSGAPGEELARILRDLAIEQHATGAVTESVRAMEEARSLLASRHAADTPLVLGALRDLVWAQRGAGRYQDALETSERALRVAEAAAADTDLVVGLLTDHGTALDALGRPSEAKVEYERALAIETANEGAQTQRASILFSNLAGTAAEFGDFETATNYRIRALDLARKHFGETSEQVGFELLELAILHLHKGEAEAALQAANEGLARYGEHYADDDARMAYGRRVRAAALSKLGLHDDAHRELSRALEVLQRVFAVEPHQSRPEALAALAIEDWYLGNKELGLERTRRALKDLTATLGSQHPLTANVAADLAVMVADAGEFVEAEPLARDALSALRETLGTRQRSVAVAAWNLAEITARRHGEQKAVPLRQAAADLWQEIGAEPPADLSFA